MFTFQFLHTSLKKYTKLSKTNIFFSHFGGTRGEKNPQTFRTPETCHVCMKEFETKDLVKNHISKIHKEVQRDYYKCSICKTSFSSNPTLIEHLKSEHSLVYQCSQQGNYL